MITAVTTCMGRRDHLEMTLPLMLEEFERVIVVDWSCPQDSGHWAKAEGAQIVYRRGEKYWNGPKARNAGAREVESRSVCFLDADTLVMPGIRVEIERMLNLSTMVLASRTSENIDIQSLNGFIALDIGQFWGVKGYNETLEGYGLEDGYLRSQLLLERGLLPKRLSPGVLAAIRHTNEMRQRYMEESIAVSGSRNYATLMNYLQSHGISNWIENPITADIAYRPE